MAKLKFNEAQQKIIDHREGNMIVSASAGSGKTTVMLERVLGMIEEGTAIDRIVILAFNNSIAAEIRAKMYKKLMERLKEVDNSKQEFIKEQIDRLPFCNIITNDSYCKRTASEFFQIIGINPNADITSEVEKKIMFGKAFKSAIGELKETCRKIFDLALKFGGEDKLLSQITAIHNYVATQSGGMMWLDKVISGVYTEDISKSTIMTYLFDMVDVKVDSCCSALSEIVELMKIYANECPEDGGKKLEIYQQYLTFFEGLKANKDYDEFRKLILSLEFVKKERAKKNVDIDWDRYSVDFYKVKNNIIWLQNKFEKPLKVVQALHKGTIADIKLLVNLYKTTLAKYTNLKEKAGKYDFADFPKAVIELLSDKNIQKELSMRYDYICVDEYQDTNYVQEEIYTNISNGNNLFMVGDSKQSIYRFRLSEPKILLDKYNDYKANEEHGSTIRLDNNYRSDEGIVNFVNEIFNDVMTKEYGGIDYKSTDQLVYGAKFDNPQATSYEVHIFHNPEKEGKETITFDKVYSVRNDIPEQSEISTSYKEGIFIANKIRQILKNYKIYDAEIKGMRNVRLSDIALLARSGKPSVREVVRAIQDAKIPIDIAPLLKEQGVYEVEIIKDILRLVVNDMQDYPLASVLVSYFVGLDYDDLLDIRAKQPKAEYFWNAVKAEQENNQDIQKMYKFIENLRIKASYMSIKDLAEYIVYDCGFDKYILTQDGGEFKLTAVKTYLATLGDLSSGYSLQEYVATLTDEKMEIKGGSSGDMVRAMTIHKSKGLEFPVVFVCNIDEDLDNSKGLAMPKIQINKDAGIAINYFDEDTMTSRSNLAFDVLLEKNRLEDKAEAMRLFYVALTRPKNHIILTGSTKAQELEAPSLEKSNSFLDWVLIASQSNPKLKNSIISHKDEDEKPQSNMQRYTFMKYNGASIDCIDKYLDFEYKDKKAQNLSIKYTVTEINKQCGNKNSIFVEYEEIDEEENNSDIDRAKRGTAYHIVLENIDFNSNTLDKVNSEINRLVSCGILTEQDVQSIDSNEILSILNSKVFDYARKSKCYREQEFTLYTKACDVLDTDVEDKVLVQGTIDLLIVGEEVWIVDYKKSDESDLVLLERYKMQLKLYSIAVQKGIGRKVDKAMLFVIGSGKVIELQVD